MKRRGSFMHKHAWQVILLALIPFALAAPAHAADCTLKQYASIDIVLTGTGNVLVPVSFGDTPAYMWLGTSTTTNALANGVADELKLPMKILPGGGGGERRAPHVVTTDSFKIGPMSVQAITFIQNPNMKESEPIGELGSRKIIGRLGMSPFSSTDFELDFAKHKLNVYSPDHCDGQVVYWADKYSTISWQTGALGNIVLPMELEGQKIEASLNTDASHTFLNSKVAKRLFNVDLPPPNKIEKPDGSIAYGEPSNVQFMDLTNNGLTVMNAEVALFLSDCSIAANKDRGMIYSDCIDRVPLAIGTNVLQKLHLYFAMKEKVLYFTAADATK